MTPSTFRHFDISTSSMQRKLNATQAQCNASSIQRKLNAAEPPSRAAFESRLREPQATQATQATRTTQATTDLTNSHKFVFHQS